MEVLGLVSCPRWYYCGNRRLTCLLPPEASTRLRAVMGADFQGLCPDLIMSGSDGGFASTRAKDTIGRLYDEARSSGMGRYTECLSM